MAGEGDREVTDVGRRVHTNWMRGGSRIVEAANATRDPSARWMRRALWWLRRVGLVVGEKRKASGPAMRCGAVV